MPRVKGSEGRKSGKGMECSINSCQLSIDNGSVLSLPSMGRLTIAVNGVSGRSDFYVNTLGFTPKAKWASGAYLSQRNLWLYLSADCLFVSYCEFKFTIVN